MNLVIDLSMLTERQQRVVVPLLQRATMSISEIAEAEGTKPSAIYARIDRAEKRTGMSFGRWSRRGRPKTRAA